MKKVSVLVGLVSALFVTSVSAQSFSFYGEPGQILDSKGTILTPANADGFYAITASDAVPSVVDPLAPTAEEVAGLISNFTWSPLLNGTAAGVDWMTPGGELGQYVDLAVGQQPLFAFFDSLSSPTEVAVIAGATFLSTLDNRPITAASGNYSFVVGQAGSIQTVPVVPEPSTFALLGGVLALGFVMYRRRR